MTDPHGLGAIREGSAEPVSAALRIAVVGPTHPPKGRAPAHTTMLAHHLADAGHDVLLVAWASSHPAGLAGPVAAPETGPAVPPFPRTIRALRPSRPDTWLRVGRRLRAVDAILVVDVPPVLVPGHVVLLRAAGSVPGRGSRRRAATGQPGRRPQSVAICLHGLPPEPPGGGARLLSWLLSSVDATLVHSEHDARVAGRLGAARVAVAELPPPVRAGEPAGTGRRSGATRLLMLGLTVEHEGLDPLLHAMRSVPDVTLTAAGPMSGARRAAVEELTGDPSLAGRVRLHDRDVPADELAALLADHDVLVLPSRAASATQDVALAHIHGLPVLAPAVTPFDEQVQDGRTGLLVLTWDEEALVAALRRLGDADVWQRLADGVQTPDLSGTWATYLGTVEALSVDEAAVVPEPDEPEAAEGPGRSRAADSGHGRPWAAGLVRDARAGLGALRARRRTVVALGGDDLPDWVRPTDALVEPAEADDARHVARLVGLPRTRDAMAAWAALGALAAILRVRDDGRRSAVVVDAAGGRSLFSRWARAVGFAPVEIDFTGTSPSLGALDIDPGSLDVVVRIHPQDCDADDVDELLEQASWALRPGGLLVITVPVGPFGAPGAMGPADVRGVLARAHDLGFVLVGDLDGDVTARVRAAAGRARAGDAAYGLVRLTLRRR
ncbi:MAG TPA: glycosyltransferase family 4 protein [Intrasporangium sp.]|uniref:glycosyltransferase family 4 protein n=1 Tax=Intrasporangium sp. TaxID=1925024 RepID=UPI002D766CA3|nr:glycosyltransferase family 4 protein [Intrasporangium sp.]HET7399718.1 glycosyltransferase family 4 protein [Intrasporangium sp.]